MKTRFVLLTFFVLFKSTFTQENFLWPPIELIMQSVNSDNDQITISLESISPIWDYSIYSGNFFLTTNPNILNSSVSLMGTNTTNNYGWDIVGSANSGGPVCGIGVYKMKATPGSGYFYIDFRECRFARGSQGEIDTWFRYNKTQDQFYWNDLYRINQWNSIENGSLIRIWDIKQALNGTSCIPDFWSNSLVIIPTTNNNPLLIWGQHPTFSTTNYKVYRAVSNTPVSDPSTLSYALRYTSPNASTFSFTDGDVLIGTGQYFYYYVTACQVRTPKPVWESERSNYTSVHGGMYKKASEESKSEEALITDYKLTQNYPNPFNPSTTISYQIPTKSFVTLKVYDVLGNEVAELVNEWKKPGSYYAQFTTSGMYFYSLTAGKFTDTKKFILLK